MESAESGPAAPSITLQGDALSWLDLMLTGAIDSRYAVPGDHESSAGGPELVLPPDVAAAALAAGYANLLDPEGVTLARVHVDSTAPLEGRATDSAWVFGEVEAVSGFSHLDHVAWRHSPATLATEWLEGPVIALWADAPVPLSVREATRRVAREGGGSVLEVVPVPSGRETSRSAHLAARLVRHESTRDEPDRPVVIPAPSLLSDPSHVLTKVGIVARYGATALAVPPVAWDSATIDSVRKEASAQGVELIELDVDPTQARLSEPDLDALLTAGSALPEWYAEPAVADEIQRLHRPRSAAGLTVLLSGLSGSGKSTVARALAVRLMETEFRSVTLLDGDVVRHHLSKGLGFARADRDTNVRRIGFVASEITKAGGIAICCPIAPYDATRKDVRAMVEAEGGFVLVHVATPLEECERRDRKGLYAKARRGEIPEFTGISDPYETPQDAELVVDTTGRTIESCVNEVMNTLRAQGYLT